MTDAKAYTSEDMKAAEDDPREWLKWQEESDVLLDRLPATVKALESAQREAERLREALQEMVEKGEGCPACGDGTKGGCGCRYERARAALEVK